MAQHSIAIIHVKSSGFECKPRSRCRRPSLLTEDLEPHLAVKTQRLQRKPALNDHVSSIGVYFWLAV